MQSVFALVENDEIAYIHQEFMKTFEQMMDIVAIDSAHESYKLQFSASPPYNDDERLAMNETAEMSAIFRYYVTDQMRNHSFQDITNAASNRKGNYYVWNKTLWLNHSSGHALSNEEEAITANQDLLVETLDNTYFKLLYPSKQGLEKRFIRGIRAGRLGAKLRNPQVKAVPQKPKTPVGVRAQAQPIPQTPVWFFEKIQADPQWYRKIFTEGGIFNPTIIGQTPAKLKSRPFQQVARDIQTAYKLRGHPVLRRVAKSKKAIYSSYSWRKKKHPYFRRYLKLQRLRLSPNPKTRRAAEAELQRMRDYMQLTEKVLDTISYVFKIY
jgi:hypothetical protein